MMKGVVEVRWPGETTFKTILNEPSITATSAMTTTLRQLGAYWLVERTLSHGSEGLYGEGANAVLCDLSAKKCTE
jgi:hypothetical protein